MESKFRFGVLASLCCVISAAPALAQELKPNILVIIG